MTEEQDNQPTLREYPRVWGEYYRDHPYRLVFHLLMTVATTGLWAAIWWGIEVATIALFGYAQPKYDDYW